MEEKRIKINDWSLIEYNTISETGNLILSEDFEPGKYIIVGKVSDNNEFPNETIVRTSKLKSFSLNEALTQAYYVELGEMNKDYKKFLEIYYKKTMPIVKHWRIQNGRLSGIIFQQGIYRTTSRDIESENIINGTIISQDTKNNICVIVNTHRKQKIFVDWLSVTESCLLQLKLNQVLYSVPKFSNFVNVKCMPKII